MAGDWIKIEENMPDKPEVWQIAQVLQIDPDAVAGKLIRVWSWASRNCHASGVTTITAMSLIDRHAGAPGFAEAMEKAGWLIVENETLCFPNFDRHISKSAKDRALGNERQKKKRHANVTKKSRSNRDKNVTPLLFSSLTNEFKKDSRTRDKKDSPTLPDEFDVPEFRDAWAAWQQHRREIRKPITPTSLKQQLAQFTKWGVRRSIRAIEHTITKGWTGLREPDEDERPGPRRSAFGEFLGEGK